MTQTEKKKSTTPSSINRRANKQAQYGLSAHTGTRAGNSNMLMLPSDTNQEIGIPDLFNDRSIQTQAQGFGRLMAGADFNEPTSSLWSSDYSGW